MAQEQSASILATANRILIALDQAKICEQQLLIAADKDAESQKQLEILRSTIKLYEEQIEAFKNLRTMDEAISIQKDKACREEIKAAKPTFMRDMGKYSTGAVVGAGLFGLLLLLL